MQRLRYVWRDIKLPFHLLRAVVASTRYRFPARSLHIIGITGTDGKTTTSTMVYTHLREAGLKVALISTVAAYIGDSELDTGFHVTSPDPLSLQRLLRRLVNEGYTHLVLEVTSHGIHQYRVWGVTPEITVLTNISHEHLDYHGTYEEYVRVKASFIARAKKRAFINHDDRSYELVKAYLQHQDVAYTAYGRRSLSAMLRQQIAAKFPEKYNQLNAIAACSVLMELGFSEEQCERGVQAFKGVRGRMQRIPNEMGIEAIVDFAHTPNALESALKAIRSTTPKGKKIIAVFGAAGQRDHTKRPLMGRVAADLADEVVLTSEDPRSEDPEVIIRQLKEGVQKNWGHVFGIVDRHQAIQFAVNILAKKGDVVAVFGKGHEQSMNLDGKTEVPWSDQAALEKILKEKKR